MFWIIIHNVLFTAAEEAFKFFDKRDQEKIKTGDISGAMKRIGHNVKGDWMEKMNDYIDEDGQFLQHSCQIK